MSAGLAPSARLLLNIETPRGLRRAAGIAAAHPRVAGLQLGLGDLFELHGIRRDEPAHVRQVMFQLAMAAAEAGVFACDGAHPDYTDGEGFGARPRWRARPVGKSCIHQGRWPGPTISSPTPGELIGRKVVDVAQAAANGSTVFSVDGRMVDPPYLRRAERLLGNDASTRAEAGKE